MLAVDSAKHLASKSSIMKMNMKLVLLAPSAFLQMKKKKKPFYKMPISKASIFL